MALTWRGRLDRTLKQLTFVAMAIAAAAIALCFFSLAAWVFMSERYNAIVGSLVLGGVYLVLTQAALICSYGRKKRRAGLLQSVPRSYGKSDRCLHWFEVLRALGPRKVAPFAAVVCAAWYSQRLVSTGGAPVVVVAGRRRRHGSR